MEFAQDSNNTLYEEINKPKFKLNEALISEILVENRQDSAEWNYLYSLYLYNKSWFDSALTHINKAIILDPANEEYKEALDGFTSNNIKYFSYHHHTHHHHHHHRSVCCCNCCDCCDCCDIDCCECNLCEFDCCD